MSIPIPKIRTGLFLLPKIIWVKEFKTLPKNEHFCIVPALYLSSWPFNLKLQYPKYDDKAIGKFSLEVSVRL